MWRRSRLQGSRMPGVLIAGRFHPSYRAPGGFTEGSSALIQLRPCEWDLLSLADSFVDHHQHGIVPFLQLFVRIEQLDPVHGAVGSHVNVQRITDADRFHFRGLLAKPQIRDVVPRVVCELHDSRSGFAKVFHDHSDHEPAVTLSDGVGFHLLCGISPTSPKFRRKPTRPDFAGNARPVQWYTSASMAPRSARRACACG